MFIITDQQLQLFGEFAFYEKLLSLFSQIKMPLSSEDENQIQQNLGSLVTQAQSYGLISEKHIAAFIFSSWLMGLGFEQKFQVVKSTLNNPDLSADQKMNWLSAWTQSIFNYLETKK
jgi:hypothetical protein